MEVGEWSGGMLTSQVSAGCRACDIVASASLLVLFLPLILAVSVVGLALFGGRLFAVVPRADGCGRIVYVARFRVAAPIAETAPFVRGISSFMVLSRIHALPELVGVLTGTLSLFGAASGRPILIQK